MGIATQHTETLISAGDEELVGLELEELVPDELLTVVRKDEQRSIPMIAKDPKATAEIQTILKRVPSVHKLMLGDSRNLIQDIPSESIHLAITSPPYWKLKKYRENKSQLGHIDDYDKFLKEIRKVWKGVFRSLVPGGRLVIVVGDVCLSRRKFGRHVVIPLHASIQEDCRSLGYDNLTPIIWHKISNADFEVNGGSGFLGKPYEPNAVVKNDIEFILFQRKPGGYRKPSLAARVLSVIPSDLHQQYFQQIWRLSGASTRRHPAPYPLTLTERLIRMFSFVGDTVLDPFMGTGTSNLSAGSLGRNSIGIEVEPAYFKMAESAVMDLQSGQRHLAI